MRSVVWLFLSLVPLCFVTAALVLVRFQRWYVRETSGTGYFGRTSEGKRAFAEEVQRRGRTATWIASRIARMHKPKPPVGVEVLGVTAPPQCRPKDFARAVRYEPETGDVFVVTQMKCGTTWMQQLVYEILMRGRGNLGDDGGRHIYAVSPWIESSWAVPLDDAPRLGDSGMRLIKTHMPTKLLPIGEKARYIYVTRHPVACFASCADFVSMLAGPLAPSREDLLTWFCSDRMWWGSWPDHVEGWWRAAECHSNVLFVHFEEMRADLSATVDRVVAHLGVALLPAEREAVVRKSHFDYMKAHEEQFSMAPPTPFVEPGGFFPSGRADRHTDVILPERAKIVAFCRERLRDGAYPVARFYPDLAS